MNKTNFIKLSLLIAIYSLCNVSLFGQTTIAIQDFETSPATPTLGITSSTNTATSSGTSVAPTGDNSHASEGTQGLINTSDAAAATIEFDAVDVSSYANITVSLRVAALASSTSNGMDGAEYLTIAISTDNGATYSDEIRVLGKSNARWGFTTGTGVASVSYDGNNSATDYAPGSGGTRTTDGYSTVTVSDIPQTSTLKIKVTFEDNSATEQWAVDEVKVTGETGVGFESATSSLTETSTTHQVNVIMITAPASDLTVQITDAGTGSATVGSGNDYEFTTTDLTFTTGETYPATKTVNVTINTDNDTENDETIVLNLAVTSGSSPTYNTTHTITIEDDDCAASAIDNFTDGDFTSSPSWSGDQSSYSIVTDALLPNNTTGTDETYLGSNASVGKSTLVTSSSNTSQWEFSLASGDFAPSTTNYFGVILMSDVRISGEITATSWNGYYLRIGSSGSGDQIDFYRMDAGTPTQIGTFNTTVYGADAIENGVDIKVTRDGSGNFELFYADNSFNYTTAPTTSAGMLTDNTHSSSCYFGIYTMFNSPSSERRILIDNINDTSDPLPVELISFDAKNKDKYIQLLWQTASELNNSHFEIEHSSDGVNFKKIGREEGFGNTNDPQSYVFDDKQPTNGENYYRLKQVDFDGKFEYSHIVSVNIETNTDQVRLFPNPVMDHLNVELLAITSNNAQIEIINSAGQILKSDQLNGNNQILNVSDLPSGFYILRLQNDNQVITKRFLKAK